MKMVDQRPRKLQKKMLLMLEGAEAAYQKANDYVPTGKFAHAYMEYLCVVLGSSGKINTLTGD
jgi:hypothetical protein